MNINKWFLFYAFFGIIGAVLIFYDVIIGFGDTFWYSLGIAFFAISAVRIYRLFKYKNNEGYAKKINIENADERNKFLADKARGFAFAVYLTVSGVAVILLRICNYRQECEIVALSACALIFLYWVGYFFASKKY